MALEYPDGGLSSFIIGVQSGDTPVTDKSNMVGTRYPVVNWSINEDGTLEDSASLRASRSPALGEDGILSVSGSVEIEILLEKMLHFWNGALWGTPVSTGVPAKTIVAAGTALADIQNSSYFTASSTKTARNPAVGRPGQLDFTFSSENASGSIEIVGRRRIGLGARDVLEQRETIALSSTGGQTTEVTSTKWFHEIETITIKNSTGAAFTTGTLQIDSAPGGYSTAIPLSDSLPDPWTIEAEIAKKPMRLEGVRAVNTSIAVGSPNRLTMNVIGRRLDQYRTIEGGSAEQLVSTAAGDTSTFPFPDNRFYPAWGGYLTLDGVATLFTGANFDIDQGASIGEGLQGSRFSNDLDLTTRNITGTVNTFFRSGTATADNFIRWQDRFRQRDSFAVTAVIHHWPLNGRQYTTTISLPNCLVNAPVPHNVSDRGRVPLTINLQAYPSSDGAVDDISVTVVGADQWA